MLEWEVGEWLVRADVERAKDERPPLQALGDALVGRVLLVLARHRIPLEEEKLGAQKAHTLGAVLDRGGHIVGRADVGDDLDPAPVLGHRRLGSGRPSSSSRLLTRSGTSLVFGGELLGRLDVDDAGIPVQEQCGALGHAQ